MIDEPRTIGSAVPTREDNIPNTVDELTSLVGQIEDKLQICKVEKEPGNPSTDLVDGLNNCLGRLVKRLAYIKEVLRKL